MLEFRNKGGEIQSRTNIKKSNGKVSDSELYQLGGGVFFEGLWGCKRWDEGLEMTLRVS